MTARKTRLAMPGGIACLCLLQLYQVLLVLSSPFCATGHLMRPSRGGSNSGNLGNFMRGLRFPYVGPRALDDVQEDAHQDGVQEGEPAAEEEQEQEQGLSPAASSNAGGDEAEVEAEAEGSQQQEQSDSSDATATETESDETSATEQAETAAARRFEEEGCFICMGTDPTQDLDGRATGVTGSGAGTALPGCAHPDQVHESCLVRWFVLGTGSASCPLCRSEQTDLGALPAEVVAEEALALAGAAAQQPARDQAPGVALVARQAAPNDGIPPRVLALNRDVAFRERARRAAHRQRDRGGVLLQHMEAQASQQIFRGHQQRAEDVRNARRERHARHNERHAARSRMPEALRREIRDRRALRQHPRRRRFVPPPILLEDSVRNGPHAQVAQRSARRDLADFVRRGLFRFEEREDRRVELQERARSAAAERWRSDRAAREELQERRTQALAALDLHLDSFLGTSGTEGPGPALDALNLRGTGEAQPARAPTAAEVRARRAELRSIREPLHRTLRAAVSQGDVTPDFLRELGAASAAEEPEVHPSESESGDREGAHSLSDYARLREAARRLREASARNLNAVAIGRQRLVRAVTPAHRYRMDMDRDSLEQGRGRDGAPAATPAEQARARDRARRWAAERAERARADRARAEAADDAYFAVAGREEGWQRFQEAQRRERARELERARAGAAAGQGRVAVGDRVRQYLAPHERAVLSRDGVREAAQMCPEGGVARNSAAIFGRDAAPGTGSAAAGGRGRETKSQRRRRQWQRKRQQREQAEARARNWE